MGRAQAGAAADGRDFHDGGPARARPAGRPLQQTAAAHPRSEPRNTFTTLSQPRLTVTDVSDLSAGAAGEARVGLPDVELAELHAEPVVPQRRRRRLHHWRRRLAAAAQRGWDFR